MHICAFLSLVHYVKIIIAQAGKECPGQPWTFTEKSRAGEVVFVIDKHLGGLPVWNY